MSLRFGDPNHKTWLYPETWSCPGQMPEFRQRVDVLRRLGYVADDSTVQLKVPPASALVACMASPDMCGLRFSMHGPVSAVRHVPHTCFWKWHRLAQTA